jgi:hypothetical protein
VPHGFYLVQITCKTVVIALHLLAGEDVGVTGIEDSHGAGAEELTASSTKLNL